jgi:FxLD family lantipeptide
MSTSVTEAIWQAGTASPVQEDFDLDVSIVEKGGAADVLLCSTDNGCNTLAGSDC